MVVITSPKSEAVSVFAHQVYFYTYSVFLVTTKNAVIVSERMQQATKWPVKNAIVTSGNRPLVSLNS